MQNTTANVVMSTSSSLKQEKSESTLPRLTPLNNVCARKQEKSLGLVQKILKFFLALLAGKTPAAHKAKPGKQARQESIVLQCNKAERPVIPVETTPMRSEIKPDMALRTLAEQQFAAMDVTRATRN